MSKSRAKEPIVGIFEPGLSIKQLTDIYDEWGENGNYKKDLDGIYNGPEITADSLAEQFPDKASRSDLYILDVAAGTGLLAEKLIQKGFKKIDALEPSKGLLNMVISKQIYNRTYRTSLSDKPTEVEADLYDAVVISGGFGENHIPCSGLDELIRVTKPGGVVIFIMSEYSLTNVAEYNGRLEKRMKEHERNGKWVSIRRKVVPEYFQGYSGVVFVFKVL